MRITEFELQRLLLSCIPYAEATLKHIERIAP